MQGKRYGSQVFEIKKTMEQVKENYVSLQKNQRNTAESLGAYYKKTNAGLFAQLQAIQENFADELNKIIRLAEMAEESALKEHKHALEVVSSLDI